MADVFAESKEWTTLQARLSGLIAEHHRITDNIARKEYEDKMSKLTIKELECLPPKTKVYKSMGRAFLLSEMDQVKDKLNHVSIASVSEKEKLKRQKSQLEDTIASFEQKFKQIYEPATDQSINK